VKQELGPNQLKWIEALESGEYQQGIGRLAEGGDFGKCGSVVIG
jgi:hypothetical protein